MTPGSSHAVQDQTTLGIQPGDVLAGKYRVEKLLGAGGMGVVVAARHLRLDEMVAIKLLQPAIAHHAEVAERFAREARAASKIRSEHVARVSDVDTLPDGAPYIVMEYLDGCDLGQYLGARGALPIEQAVGFVLQACEALAEAHALKIVHRDLKPSNLFLTQRRDRTACVKVLDFGISKITGGEALDGAVTRTQSVVGSPSYMSPEHMLSARSVDHRADIWALGVILYQLITARLPFHGDTLPEICGLVLQAVPEPLCAHRPDVPPGLEAVVHRCLQKDRNRRFGDVGELAAALVRFGPPEGRLSAERARGVLGSEGPGAAPSSPWVPPGGPLATMPIQQTTPAPTQPLPHLAAPALANTPGVLSPASALGGFVQQPSFPGSSTTRNPGDTSRRAPAVVGVVFIAVALGGGGAYLLHRRDVATVGAAATALDPAEVVVESAAPAAPAPTVLPAATADPPDAASLPDHAPASPPIASASSPARAASPTKGSAAATPQPPKATPPSAPKPPKDTIGF